MAGLQKVMFYGTLTRKGQNCAALRALNVASGRRFEGAGFGRGGRCNDHYITAVQADPALP